ncbi:FAD/NAD(P)-binding domain-containing protein [Cryphonectria parasitica EP155]|uniref:FAD/NAD(P)-binding domain-containing protein n=1 Tax=Cryphonectria parasitica (strain ATCC 38755 / EP155) TaxID=660469 RepID=A0A9P4XZJ9_CRYP1|nr:FAD/NAD(P)-binding domain-containing protein [Cryphonectria parasitica EP155]KAF3764242.1 FAD/NAD(P)-binding domain-containing protein [Cryphonectria parasitica EP155]
MGGERLIKSVAIIGAGASGTIAAAALKAENYFDRIQVFERRDSAGGTWIFDPSPGPELPIEPGKLPPEIDPPLSIPNNLPRITAPSEQERYSQTPVYNSLTTNVPDVAMCFSDERFAYGPFPPHHVPRQYLENYVARHRLDEHLVLNTTVEDVSRMPPSSGTGGPERWELTLRKHDVLRHVDIWWTEIFDAVIISNGHYSVPYIPHVEGLEAYTQKYPDRVVHSKYYRSPSIYKNQRVLTIGNSASGWDIMNELTTTAALPVHSSRRHKSPFEGDKPGPGIEWRPVIRRYQADGTIEFEDGTTLGPDEIDRIVYCTGYRPSYPFWNTAKNGRPMYDYEVGKLVNTYWHTFFSDFSTLAIVGIQKALTFRSFEYQAVAVARLFAGRNALPLPPAVEMRRWEAERRDWVLETGKKFHDVESMPGRLGQDTLVFLGFLYSMAGLGTLKGDGRIPPVLSQEVLYALRNIHKYPTPGDDPDKELVVTKGDKVGGQTISDYDYRYEQNELDEWVIVVGNGH